MLGQKPHNKGIKVGFEERINTYRKKFGKDPVLSPFVPETIICYSERDKRWVSTTRNSRSSHIFHAKLVWEYYNGKVPPGHHVHHKNGDASKLEYDDPENLMLLSEEWNFKRLPVLAKGFGVHESVVTNLYIELLPLGLNDEDLFCELCTRLVLYKKGQG